MESIGQRIKELRKKDGGNMTQKEFASLVNITRQYLSLLENDERVPSAMVVDSISWNFGVRHEWITDGIEPKYIEPLCEELEKAVEDNPKLSRILHSFAGFATLEDWQALNAAVESAIAGKIKEAN